MPEKVFRPLLPTEVDEAVELVRASFTEKPHYAESYARREIIASFAELPPGVARQKFVVAEQAGKKVGLAAYVMSGLSDRIWELAWNCVLPEHRHQGIGLGLVKYRLECIKQDMRPDGALVLVHTYPNQAYASLGFQSACSTGEKTLLWLKIDTADSFSPIP